jgi:hypothetical protein
MKSPADLFPQSSRRAIHWLRKTVMHTEMFGDMEVNGTACGKALDASAWSERAATEPHRVTCKKCWPIANPQPPMDWTTKP